MTSSSARARCRSTTGPAKTTVAVELDSRNGGVLQARRNADPRSLLSGLPARSRAVQGPVRGHPDVEELRPRLQHRVHRAAARGGWDAGDRRPRQRHPGQPEGSRHGGVEGRPALAGRLRAVPAGPSAARGEQRPDRAPRSRGPHRHRYAQAHRQRREAGRAMGAARPTATSPTSPSSSTTSWWPPPASGPTWSGRRRPRPSPSTRSTSPRRTSSCPRSRGGTSSPSPDRTTSSWCRNGKPLDPRQARAVLARDPGLASELRGLVLPAPPGEALRGDPGPRRAAEPLAQEP